MSAAVTPIATSAADRRQYQAFGEQLRDDAPAAGTERRSHRELTGAAGRLRKEKACDVGTAHEQYEPDDAEQQQRGQPDVAPGEGFTKRLQRHAVPLVALGKLFRQPCGDRVEVGLRALEAHVWFQPADDRQQVGQPLPRGSRARGPEENPDLRWLTSRQSARRHQLERGWHYAYQVERLAVDDEAAANGGRIRPEARPPERLADHHGLRARCHVRLLKGPADERRDAEDVEEADAHQLREQLFRSAIGRRHPGQAQLDRGRRHQCAVLSRPVVVIGRRRGDERVWSAALPEHHEAVGGVGERQRAQECRVCQREDRAVGADAERQRQYRHHREAGRAPELPQREPDVGPALLEPRRQSHLAIPPSRNLHARPSDALDVSRIDGLALAAAHLQVERQFLLHFLVDGHTPQPRPQGTPHHSSRNAVAGSTRVARHAGTPAAAAAVSAITTATPANVNGS